MRFWIRCYKKIEFEYRDHTDKEVCEKCLNEEISGKCHKSRYAARNSKGDKEYIYCHDKNVVAKQAKHISKITTRAFSTITKAAKKRSRDLNEIQTIAYHNAKKMNASIGQKIDKIIPGYSNSKAVNRIDIIISEIQRAPETVAKEILNVLKTVEQVEAEYNLIEVLDLSEPFTDKDLTRIKVHKLLVSGYYLYQEEFNAKKIYVKVNETNLSVKVDYGVAKSAISQIFNNALKYCKPATTLDVKVVEKGNYINIVFSMTSSYFSSEESEKLTDMGVRGSEIKNISGDGVGLFAVVNYMRMHKGFYEMISNESTKFNSGEITYSENTLTLGFYKYDSE